MSEATRGGRIAAGVVLLIMMTALVGWAEEPSYQGVVLGTPWEDIPFLKDMELTERQDALIPGRIYRRSGEVLGYTTEEMWYEWEGKVQVIKVVMRWDIRDTMLYLLEKRYGKNLSTGWDQYWAISGQGSVWLEDNPLGKITLIYMTLKILEAGAAMEQGDAAGL